MHWSVSRDEEADRKMGSLPWEPRPGGIVLSCLCSPGPSPSGQLRAFSLEQGFSLEVWWLSGTASIWEGRPAKAFPPLPRQLGRSSSLALTAWHWRQGPWVLSRGYSLFFGGCTFKCPAVQGTNCHSPFGFLESGRTWRQPYKSCIFQVFLEPCAAPHFGFTACSLKAWLYGIRQLFNQLEIF